MGLSSDRRIQQQESKSSKFVASQVYTGADTRPRSAVFNNFGPLKRQHLTKAKSLLSTAASHQRFSNNSRGAASRGLPSRVMQQSNNQGMTSYDHFGIRQMQDEMFQQVPAELSSDHIRRFAGNKNQSLNSSQSSSSVFNRGQLPRFGQASHVPLKAHDQVYSAQYLTPMSSSLAENQVLATRF